MVKRAYRVKPRTCDCGRVFEAKGSRDKWCCAVCHLWGHLRARGPDECWPTMLVGNGHGYGHFKCRGEYFYAHVIACEVEHGPMPKGWYASQACGNRACCNPAHVRPKLTIDHNRNRQHVNYATGPRHGRWKDGRRSKWRPINEGEELNPKQMELLL